MSLEELVAQRRLQEVESSAAHASALLMEAGRHLVGARSLAVLDPVGAYQLAYDAARKSAVAVLAGRGLRPTARGGHLAVVEALRALEVDGFEMLDIMRRQRNRLEYPEPDDPRATVEDARLGVEWASEMHARAETIIAKQRP